MKDSTNGKKPIRAPKIRKLDLGVRKPGGSDIDWSNPCRNQATHFVDCIKSPNAPNSFYNRKKTCNTFEVGSTMCVSFANKEKTQVGWTVAVGRRV
jgi:hypothetical protein